MILSIFFFFTESIELSKRLGEILIERGKLDAANLERAQRLHASEAHSRMGDILVKAGMVSERDMIDALAADLNLPVVSLADYPELPVLEERVTVRFIKETRALPLREDDELLLLQNRSQGADIRQLAVNDNHRPRVPGRTYSTFACFPFNQVFQDYLLCVWATICGGSIELIGRCG